jgi:hypothetical protein
MSRIVSNQTQNAAGEYYYIPATTDVQTPYGGVYATLESPQLDVTALDANLQQGISFDPRIVSVPNIVTFDVSGAMPFQSRNALTRIQNTNASLKTVEIDLNGGFGAMPIGTYYYIHNVTPVGSSLGAWGNINTIFFVSIDSNNVKTQLGLIQPGDTTLLLYVYTTSGWVRTATNKLPTTFLQLSTTALTPLPAQYMGGFIQTYNTTPGGGARINIDITSGGLGYVPGTTWIFQQTMQSPAQDGRDTNLCDSTGRILFTLLAGDFAPHGYIYTGLPYANTYGFSQLY